MAGKESLVMQVVTFSKQFAVKIGNKKRRYQNGIKSRNPALFSKK